MPDLETEDVVDLHQSCSGGDDAELTLEQCMVHYTESEVLSEHDMWYCSKCKKHTRAQKTITLWSVPRLLVIHLKRFSQEEGYSGRYLV